MDAIRFLRMGMAESLEVGSSKRTWALFSSRGNGDAPCATVTCGEDVGRRWGRGEPRLGRNGKGRRSCEVLQREHLGDVVRMLCFFWYGVVCYTVPWDAILNGWMDEWLE